LINGEGVLDKIGNVKTGEADRPAEDVIIEKVSVM